MKACSCFMMLVVLFLLGFTPHSEAQEPVNCMLTIYEHRDFRGRERLIVGDITNLGAADDRSFNDVISSFVVHKGKWQMFRHKDFAIPYAVTALPGKFKWVEDVGIEDNQVSSLKCIGDADETKEAIINLTKRRLECQARPREDFQPFLNCEGENFELTRWCSGDCNADDAKVTLCCRYVLPPE